MFHWVFEYTSGCMPTISIYLFSIGWSCHYKFLLVDTATNICYRMLKIEIVIGSRYPRMDQVKFTWPILEYRDPIVVGK